MKKEEAAEHCGSGSSVLTSDTDAVTTTEAPPVRVKRVGRGGGARCPCFFLVALAREKEKNKEKWVESFSHARATRKKRGQRAPPPLPSRFTRTGGASVVVTAPVSDQSTPVCSGLNQYGKNRVYLYLLNKVFYPVLPNYRKPSILNDKVGKFYEIRYNNCHICRTRFHN